MFMYNSHHEPPFVRPQLNPEVSAFQRKFINEVRRCDEMERRLRESSRTHKHTHACTHIVVFVAGYLEEELKKVNIELAPGGNVEAPDPQDMIDLEVGCVT